MPVTVPAHQAAVLPLKLAWPRRFDGVALLVGSVAPDLAYAFMPRWPFGDSHGPASILWWSVPLTVLLTSVIRRYVLPGAVHLPRLGSLHLRDYAASSRVRHRWWTTWSSALAGAATHVGWDFFTHAGGFAVWLPVLMEASPSGVAWYRLLQYASGVVGTLITGWCMVRIGRERLILRWHGPAGAAPPSAVWRAAACAVGVPLAVVAVVLPQGTLPHVLMARWLWAGVAAGAIAGVVTALGRAPEPPPEHGGRRADQTS